MARILSFPFRLAGGGVVATVEQSSDEANAEQVAALLLTKVGERPMVPGFGLTDPAFRGIDPQEVAAGLLLYGPSVRLEGVDVDHVSDAVTAVEVRFS